MEQNASGEILSLTKEEHAIKSVIAEVMMACSSDGVKDQSELDTLVQAAIVKQLPWFSFEEKGCIASYNSCMGFINAIDLGGSNGDVVN